MFLALPVDSIFSVVIVWTEGWKGRLSELLALCYIVYSYMSLIWAVITHKTLPEKCSVFGKSVVEMFLNSMFYKWCAKCLWRLTSCLFDTGSSRKRWRWWLERWYWAARSTSKSLHSYTMRTTIRNSYSAVLFVYHTVFQNFFHILIIYCYDVAE